MSPWFVNLKKHLLHIVICFGINSQIWTQDIQFSQFYATPTYTNPAFTGNTAGTRFAAIYRAQWVAFAGSFRSYNFSVDHNFMDKNSGLGFIFTKDKSGSVDLNFTKAEATYAYMIPINRVLHARLGLGVAYATRALDQSKVILPSQIANNSSANVGFQSSSYFDASFGGLLYAKKWWAGISLGHINRPQQDLNLSTTSIYTLPLLGSFHGGYRIALKQNIKKHIKLSMTPILHYKLSENWDQLDVGTYFNTPLLTWGIWYRGLPLVKNNPDRSINDLNDLKNINQDAITLLFGLDIEEARIGYSYDITISRLAGSSAGSHEISISWEIANRQQKISYKRHQIPCAKF